MDKELQNKAIDKQGKHSVEEFKKIYDQLNDENQAKVDRMIYKEYLEQLKSEDEKTLE